MKGEKGTNWGYVLKCRRRKGNITAKTQTPERNLLLIDQGVLFEPGNGIVKVFGLLSGVDLHRGIEGEEVSFHLGRPWVYHTHIIPWLSITGAYPARVIEKASNTMLLKPLCNIG